MPFVSSHDVYRLQVASDNSGLTQSITVTSATGTSTTVFGTQTYAVQVTATGLATNSVAAPFIRFYTTGAANSQATSTADCPVPLNWVQIFKVTPGQRASLITADATTSARVSISELTT